MITSKMKLLEELKSKLEAGSLYKIVFLGDSITSAEWVHPNWREIIEYVLKFELESKFNHWEVPHWNIRCIPVGLNGGTTGDILRYLEEEVLNYYPDLVFCMGTDNDAAFDISLDEQIANIKKIRAILAKNVSHFLYAPDVASGSEVKNEQYQEFVDAVMKMEPAENELVVNMFEEFKQFNLAKFYTFILPEAERRDKDVEEIDLVHPNVLGNAYIARIMLKHAFNINFDPNKYVAEMKKGVKYPLYQDSVAPG